MEPRTKSMTTESIPPRLWRCVHQGGDILVGGICPSLGHSARAGRSLGQTIGGGEEIVRGRDGQRTMNTVGSGSKRPVVETEECRHRRTSGGRKPCREPRRAEVT